MSPTPEQIAKLPKWAQDHITALTRQRDTAVRQMNEAADKDTPAPFFFEDHVCIKDGSPDVVRRYIQSRWIRFEHLGLSVTLLLREMHRGKYVLDIQYGGAMRLNEEILMQPRSYQNIYLYCPETGKGRGDE